MASVEQQKFSDLQNAIMSTMLSRIERLEAKVDGLEKQVKKLEPRAKELEAEVFSKRRAKP